MQIHPFFKQPVVILASALTLAFAGFITALIIKKKKRDTSD